MSISPNLWLCLAYYILIYVPFTIYCAHLLRKNRTITFFMKRNVTLCAATLLSQLMLNGVEIFLSPLSVYCLIDCPNFISANIKHLLYLSILDAVIIIPTIRYWLLYFNLKSSYILSHVNILSHVYILSQETGTNFFIQHRKTCIGSFKHMKKWIILFYILSIICKIIFAVTHQFQIVFLFTCAYLMLSAIFVSVIHYLLKKHDNDSFAIRKEMNYQLVIWFIVCTFYAGFAVAHLFQYALIHSFSVWMGLLSSICISYLTVLYPLKQIQVSNDDDEFQLSLQMDRSHLSDMETKEAKNNRKRSWKHFIASSKQNFDAFMQHLVNEWNVENLCFITEILQFKTNNIKKNDNSSDLGFYLAIPGDIVPKSSIVFGPSKGHGIAQQILLLYNKYIVTDSMLAINISYESRLAIDAIVDKIKKIDDVEKQIEWNSDILMFDDCLIEVSRLLDDSWFRFKNKDKF